MKISFDLDDTIISNSKFPLENELWYHKLLGLERIRSGTIQLFKELKSQGHLIYIYTTSYRSEKRIRILFHLYGIPVDRIINQQKHEVVIKKLGKSVSKFPPAFDIDVHVDDSLGVKMEGDKHGFRTIIISDGDENWSTTILEDLAATNR